MLRVQTFRVACTIFIATSVFTVLQGGSAAAASPDYQGIDLYQLLNSSSMPLSPHFAAGGEVVGETGFGISVYQAFVQTGPANFVSLVPTNLTGFTSTQAFATDGINQAGSGLYQVVQSHALLRSGTAGSTVDLHPSGHCPSWI